MVYVHGKLPDLIKEYLEYSFAKIDGVKFIVANSVILEGVNLPVDSLFILNTYSLNIKGLTNLIGRVNRLNEVFSEEDKYLKKLSPKIHFINSEKYNGIRGKMENKIKLLRNGFFKDEVKNPLLLNFNFEEFEQKLNDKVESGGSESSKIKALSEVQDLQDRERFIIFGEDTPSYRIMRILSESELSTNYQNYRDVFRLIESRVHEVMASPEWLGEDVINKIYLLFIHGLEENICNYEFARLKQAKARDFYRMFIDKLHRFSLKEHISDMVEYFYSIRNQQSGRDFYIGQSYGEKSKFNEDRNSYGQNVFIDLASKTHKELVNIALVKIKIESDFVSYILNQYVTILYELELISEGDYNKHIYGTENRKNSDFVKVGFSGSLVNRLDRDGQIKNLTLGEFGDVICKDEFREYMRNKDALMKFEVEKFIEL